MIAPIAHHGRAARVPTVNGQGKSVRAAIRKGIWMALDPDGHAFSNDQSKSLTGAMSDDPAHVIAEAVAEVQAALYDHYRRENRTSAELLAKIDVVMYDPTLIRAMHDLGYIPANSPPETNFTLPAGLE